MMRQTLTESVIADASEVEHSLYVDSQMEGTDGATTSNTSNKNIQGNYTLPCEGVKKCAGPDCSYVVSNRQKVSRCVQHKGSHSLISTGPCPALMSYIWPVSDDGRRWIGVVPGMQHNHHTSCLAK